MITLKCKMCGATLPIGENVTTVECEYCGAYQTVPRVDDERILNMFDRANICRANHEFDKAAYMYENIILEKNDEAEAYWGLCLCRYGIEYVVDPPTGKRIPTCHRTQIKSILNDDDYLKAIQFADVLAADVYRQEAEYIDYVQKSILAMSEKDEPFDIFICYKETDDAGKRTMDSVIAQDIYTELTNAGYRVFFARITLKENMLGSAYEPHIFAALNSAKVMLVVGTKPEHFNAVWVRNEWSRYIALIEQGKKKYIFPCFRDMSPYDLPQELQPLESVDVSEIGYKQDLVRNIGKLISPEKKSESRVKIEPKRVEKKIKPTIKRLVAVATNDLNNPFSRGPVSATVNAIMYKGVAFQAETVEPIGVSGVVKLTLQVFDKYGNTVCNEVSNISVQPEHDKFGKIWVLRSEDGTFVESGTYTVQMSIADSDVYRFTINVTGGNSLVQNVSSKLTQTATEAYNNVRTAQRGQKSFWIYFLLCLFLGYFGVHSFYAGKKTKGIITIVAMFAGIGGLIWLWDLIRAIATRRIPD